jgi:hypothetical protein
VRACVHFTCSSVSCENEMGLKCVVTEHDLQNLCKLVEEKDGGPAWIQMMDRSTPTMRYQAWRRDLEVFLNSYFLQLPI